MRFVKRGTTFIYLFHCFTVVINHYPTANSFNMCLLYHMNCAFELDPIQNCEADHTLTLQQYQLRQPLEKCHTNIHDTSSFRV